MIINEDKKFIFIGLPFSACSAISKELLENYNCQPLLHKHANMPVLLKTRPELNISEYQIIAVIRDPVETAFTFYNKLRNNANNAFTDPQYFIENKGYVTKKARRTFSRIKENNLDFAEYLAYIHRIVPYDNLLSDNAKYITRVIRFEHLQEDFRQCFATLGLEIKRDLPVYNETKNKIKKHDLKDEQIVKFFGPFLKYNATFFPSYTKLQVPKFSYLWFLIFRIIKKYHRLRLDLKLKDHNLSMIE